MALVCHIDKSTNTSGEKIVKNGLQVTLTIISDQSGRFKLIKLIVKSGTKNPDAILD